MNIKFKPGDKIVCLGDDWEAHALIKCHTYPSNAQILPKKDHIYTVAEALPTGYVLLKEIPVIQNGIQRNWNQDAFEKAIEEKVRYVVVEVDRRVREKRKEIVFNN